MSHRIRLRKPWTREVVRDGECWGQNDRIDLPDFEPTISRSAHSGPFQSNDSTATYHVIYRRRFNRPTGLSETDDVFLEVDPFPAGGLLIQFNSKPLVPPAAVGVETPSIGLSLTSELRSQNWIEITLPAVFDPTNLPTLKANISLRIELGDPG